jgi:NADPH2:quinone reductase
MPTMRAVVIDGYGGPDVLRIEDVQQPAPSAGDIRVRVRAFGVNRADLLQRRGMYPAPAGAPQDIPGLEYAGEVEAVGSAVEGVALGERVMGIVGGGGYAQFLITPAEHAVPIPPDMSFTDAAAIPEVFVTAHDALDRLALGRGEWILIHAVGSGVGTAALQLAGSRGAHCIGTSRTSSKLAKAAELGMEVGVNTEKEDLRDVVLRAVASGVDAVVDLIGGPLFQKTLDVVGPRGRVVVVGLTAGSRTELDLGLLLRKRIRVEGTVLRSRSVAEKTAVMKSFREKVLPSLAGGAARPIVDRVFEFKDVQAAHEHLESNANFGKVVVAVE